MPLVIICTSVEILTRRIPNVYKCKKDYLDKHSDSISILFLGNSCVLYGINPDYVNKISFNAANPGQPLFYDNGILKKYQNNWNNLDCIAIQVSYSSIFCEIDFFRKCKYNIYFGMHTSKKLAEYIEVFNSAPIVLIKRIYYYYIKGYSFTPCTDLGWCSYGDSKSSEGLVKTGKDIAWVHSKSINDKSFSENIIALKSIFEFAINKGVKLFVYTPPAYHTYNENLDSTDVNQMIAILKSFDREHSNVAYANFLYDTSFSEADYYDAVHLNEAGAKKLTCKIDSLINKCPQNIWK